jgi:hypothetical protein
MPEVTNYVKLKPGDTVTMRFDGAVYTTRAVQDPILKFSKDVSTLVMHVSELAGQPANTIFSIISEKLQQEMRPYVDREKYKRYRFTITRGTGAYDAPRILAATPV